MAGPRQGRVEDRGVRGMTYTDKPIVFKGASWVDPTSGAIAIMEDFIAVKKGLGEA